MISEDIKVEVSLFDKAGRVVGVGSEYLSSDSFFGYETIDVSVELSGTSLAKIKIVPKEQR